MKPNLLDKVYEDIPKIVSKIKPSNLKFLKPLKVKGVDLLGIGTGNLNILVNINKRYFVFRFCINKFRKEFFSREASFLMAFRDKQFIPKIRYVNSNKKSIFSMPLTILDYIPGKCYANLTYKINKKFICNLASELSKIHNLNSSKVFLNKENILIRINKRIEFLRKRLSVKSFNLINKSYKELLKFQKITENYNTIIHANVWEGNIIKTGKGIRIIDYETVCIDDPAIEIAHIFHDFKTGYIFTKSQKDIFIREYNRHRKDKTIEERIKLLFKLDILDSFLRIIEYSLASKEERSNQIFKSVMDKHSGMKILKTHFKKLKRFKIIDKDSKLKDFYSLV